MLDPPREGIHPKALEKIIRYGVDRMIYISCKPTSLQRDLEILQAQDMWWSGSAVWIGFRNGACRDDMFNTSEKFPEILCFRHFVRHVEFSRTRKNGRKSRL